MVKIEENLIPEWLEWAREIQGLCQTGLAFSKTEYDTERYKRLMEIAAEITSRYCGRNVETLKEIFLAQPGYATPKVDVRGAVIRGGKILLVQESMDQKWCMPGGWADVGEEPSKVVIREVWEESGFEVKPVKIIGVFDANKAGRPLEMFHAVKLVFLCELTGGKAKPSNETLAVDFFEFNALPELSSNRTNERHLAEVTAHLNEPSRAAWFD